jgi:hypothetical protein
LISFHIFSGRRDAAVMKQENGTGMSRLPGAGETLGPFCSPKLNAVYRNGCFTPIWNPGNNPNPIKNP